MEGQSSCLLVVNGVKNLMEMANMVTTGLELSALMIQAMRSFLDSERDTVAYALVIVSRVLVCGQFFSLNHNSKLMVE